MTNSPSTPQHHKYMNGFFSQISTSYWKVQELSFCHPYLQFLMFQTRHTYIRYRVVPLSLYGFNFHVDFCIFFIYKSATSDDIMAPIQELQSLVTARKWVDDVATVYLSLVSVLSNKLGLYRLIILIMSAKRIGCIFQC